MGGERTEEDLRLIVKGQFVKRPIAGGSGGRPASRPSLPHPRTSRPDGWTRFLENERLLAFVLLAPTVILLGLFIAYPFVMGVWLALTNTSVGNIGEFVGLKNFTKAWNDSIFRTAFWNTCFYTFWATLFKLALGMWLALLLNRHFRGKRIVRASMLLPFIVPTVLSTFAWRWMFDPTFSVLNWLLYQTGFITTKLPFLSDGDLRHVVRHRGQHVARHAVLRHHAARGPADHQHRPAGGRRRSTAPTAGSASGT